MARALWRLAHLLQRANRRMERKSETVRCEIEDERIGRVIESGGHI